MDRHKKIQVTNTQIYVCVFIQHEGKGSDWHYMATQDEGAEGGVSCHPVPATAAHLGHTFKNKKQNKNQRIKRGKQVN